MTEPVLTNDEKDALLTGMSSGEVEVHSNSGLAYAEVTAFEIGPRSRIVTNSYPRLQSLNRQFASRLGKQIELLLNAESSVVFLGIDTSAYSEACEVENGVSLILEFVPKPLDGSALLNLNNAAVETLVETFYGGLGNESERPNAEFFTPGEISVSTLFGEAALSVIAEVWKPLADLTPKLIGSHLSSGVVDCVDPGDTVISSAFELKIGDKAEKFYLIWPHVTVASLLPVFDGQKRERDPAQDIYWRQALRARVVEAVIKISSAVGRTQMTLGEIASLGPGDVLNISNPQKSTIFASKVPILEGQFGVHDGRYAIETTNWLEPNKGIDASSSQ